MLRDHFLRSVRASIPAFIACMLLMLALKPTGLPRELKMGLPWFVFMILNAVLHDRMDTERRSRNQWIATVVIAVVFSSLFGWMGAMD